jgi:hypothetical protein
MPDLPFPGSSQELAAHNEQVVLAYLAKLDLSDVEACVKELVIKGLPSGSVSKTDIAKKMHMSAPAQHNRLTRAVQHGCSVHAARIEYSNDRSHEASNGAPFGRRRPCAAPTLARVKYCFAHGVVAT